MHPAFKQLKAQKLKQERFHRGSVALLLVLHRSRMCVLVIDSVSRVDK